MQMNKILKKLQKYSKRLLSKNICMRFILKKQKKKQKKLPLPWILVYLSSIQHMQRFGLKFNLALIQILLSFS